MQAQLCPLYPGKRTLAARTGKSAKGQKATLAGAELPNTSAWCLTSRMTPRRAVVMGILVTFALGLVLAGYNGTSIYVWLTTGKVEVLGNLEGRSRLPLYFKTVIVRDFVGFLIGVCLLIGAIVEAAVLSRKRRRQYP